MQNGTSQSIYKSGVTALPSRFCRLDNSVLSKLKRVVMKHARMLAFLPRAMNPHCS